MQYVRLNILLPVDQRNAVRKRCDALKATQNLQVSFSAMVKAIVFNPARRKRVRDDPMDESAEKAMVCVPLTNTQYDTLRTEAKEHGLSAAALVRSRLYDALQ